MSIIKSFSLGSGDIRGDMFYIKHDSNNFTVIDCYLTEKDKRISEIVNEIVEQSRDKSIHRFISTHPDNDHICGIDKLFQKWSTTNFYAVKNQIPDNKDDASLSKYKELLESNNYPISQGISRRFLNDGDGEIGSSCIQFLWPDINNSKFKGVLTQVKQGSSPNNICPIIYYRTLHGASFMWMGDLETDMQTEFYEQCKKIIPQVNVLFAPHHGRESGKVPSELLKALNPDIIVIGDAPSNHIHYYDSAKTITQNSAGDIVFDALKDRIRIYTANTITNNPFCLQKEQVLHHKINFSYCGTLFL